MSEVVKDGDKELDQSSEKNRFAALAEMGDDFDPDKAQELVDEAKKSETTELVSLEDVSETTEEKSVEELTAQEASKEYLELLMDLSSNFTSVEGKNSRVATRDEDGNENIRGRSYDQAYKVFKPIYETATGKQYYEELDKHYAEHGTEEKRWDDEYLDRELSLRLADSIISAESDWRAAGESTTIEAEEAERAALEKEHVDAVDKLSKMNRGVFGKIKKGLYSIFRGKEYSRLVNVASGRRETAAEKNARLANRNLESALRHAYSEDFEYGHHSLSYDHSHDENYKDKIDEEYNNKFFDESRKEKINRAVELRRKLVADKIIEK